MKKDSPSRVHRCVSIRSGAAREAISCVLWKLTSEAGFRWMTSS